MKHLSRLALLTAVGATAAASASSSVSSSESSSVSSSESSSESSSVSSSVSSSESSSESSSASDSSSSSDTPKISGYRLYNGQTLPWIAVNYSGNLQDLVSSEMVIGGQLFDLRLDTSIGFPWVGDGSYVLDCDSPEASSIESSMLQSEDSETSTADHTLVPSLSISSETSATPTETQTSDSYVYCLDTVYYPNLSESFQYADPVNVVQENMFTFDITGVFGVDNISFPELRELSEPLKNGQYDELSNPAEYNITDTAFMLVNESTTYAGSFPLGVYPNGNPMLVAFHEAGFIESVSYSLFMNSNSSSYANKIILGGIDTNYFDTDNFYQFDWLKSGGESIASQPFLPFTGLSVTNSDNYTLALNTTFDSAPKYVDAIPVLLQPRLRYNYLPRDIVVALAVQLNAFFSTDLDRWVVDCSIGTLNASIGFWFTDLVINIPLAALLYEAEGDDGKPLTFASTKNQACLLAITHDESLGFAGLGSSFLRWAYLAMNLQTRSAALGPSVPFDDDSSLEDDSQYMMTGSVIPFAKSVTLSSSPEATIETVTTLRSEGGDQSLIISNDMILTFNTATRSRTTQDGRSASSDTGSEGGAARISPLRSWLMAIPMILSLV